MTLHHSRRCAAGDRQCAALRAFGRRIAMAVLLSHLAIAHAFLPPDDDGGGSGGGGTAQTPLSKCSQQTVVLLNAEPPVIEQGGSATADLVVQASERVLHVQ